MFLHGTSAVGGELSSTQTLGPLRYVQRQANLDQNARALADLVGKRFVSPVHTWLNCRTGLRQFTELNAILDSLIEKHKGDPTRIYVMGFSRGGYGAWDFAAKYRS